MENTKNPPVKAGDKIIITATQNSIPLGMYTVGGKRKTRSKSDVTIHSDENGYSYPLYIVGRFSDTYTIADRESKLAPLKEREKELKSELETISADIEHIEKYETEEDYVAAKLEAILSAHGSSSKKSVRVGAIKDILKVMKGSSLL